MTWHHANCLCCEKECELISVTSRCIRSNGSSCGTPVQCGPVLVAFGVPDTVDGRRSVNHLNYPSEPLGNFFWRGGTVLPIAVSPMYHKCNANVYLFEKMEITYGCVSTGMQFLSVEERATVIELPSCPVRCTISIEVIYREIFSEPGCFNCSNMLNFSDRCSMNVEFDDVLDHPEGDQSAQSTHQCTSGGQPGTNILCSQFGSPPSQNHCAEDFPCITYEEVVRSTYETTKNLLRTGIMPIRFTGCAVYTAAPVCVEYGAEHSPPGVSCLTYNPPIRYGSSGVISRSFSANVIVTSTPLQLSDGLIIGHIEANGSALMGAAIAFSTTGIPIGGCVESGTMGGTYRFPATGPDIELTTFDTGVSADFCRKIGQLLTRYYPLTNTVPGRPSWGARIS